MKQVIIHAGFHKTGTTSIQKTFAKNALKLREKSIYYPLFNLDNKIIENHSIPFYSMFTTDPGRYHINIRWKVDAKEVNEKYETQLNHIFQQKYEKIIISGEDISNLSALELERMIDKVYSSNYDVRLIVFVRSPLSYLNSSVQQQVQGGLSIQSVNYDPKTYAMEKIKNVFPLAEFFSFQEACQHEYGIIGYFLNMVGVNNFSELEFVDSNVSMSNEVIRLISYINEHLPVIQHNRINPFRKNEDTNQFFRIKGSKFKLNNKELQKYIDKIEEENQYLFDKYGASFCDKQPYLSQVDHKENENNWSDEQLEQLKLSVSVIDKNNINIKLIAYDYFKNVIHLEKDKLSYVFFEKI